MSVDVVVDLELNATNLTDIHMATVLPKFVLVTTTTTTTIQAGGGLGYSAADATLCLEIDLGC